MADIPRGHALPTRQQPVPDPVVPPGLTEATMTDLAIRLPHGQGAVRLVGYYQLGLDRIVVYDVLDEQGTRVSDIRVTFPPQHPLVAAGTVYPLSAEEVGSMRAPSGSR